MCHHYSHYSYFRTILYILGSNERSILEFEWGWKSLVDYDRLYMV